MKRLWGVGKYGESNFFMRKGGVDNGINWKTVFVVIVAIGDSQMVHIAD